MKQYQVYFRRTADEGWTYGDTYTQAAISWAACQLVWAKGWATKVVIVAQRTTGIDHEVLSHG